MTALAVQADQVRTLYAQSMPVLLANVVNASIIATVLWRTAGHAVLLAWVGLMLLMTLGRVVLRARYMKAPARAQEAPVWGRRFVAGSMLAGLLWGGGGALFFDVSSPLSQILITFAIGGMGAGAAGTLSCYMPAFWAYIIPSLLPVWIRVGTFNDPLHITMTAMIGVYALGLSLVARNANRVVSQAFRLRFDNEVLLDRLANAQLSLEETNQTLEQKVAERTNAFEEQSEALRSAQRMEAVGRLAGGIAHDFNNLLTVVLANTSLLIDQRRLDPFTLDALEEVRGAGERGAELVRQLLAFGRRQRLAPAEVDLNLVVQDVRPLLARLLTEQIALQVELHPEPLVVLVDRGQIEQVLVNLVTNARDAMPRGGHLRLRTSACGARAQLAVIDDGTGMDDSTRQRAFEPFFTTKGFGRGAGLGLATVHGIVEQSGGTIEVSSRPGQGSCFTVNLPCLPRQAPRLAAPVQPPALAATPPPEVATVLLAEDDPVVRDVTDRVLRHLGHTVVQAENGEAALALAEQYPKNIDLLITDVIMGKMSGPELAKQLTARRPGMRVLLISGYSWDHAAPKPDVEGRYEFLHKPFSAESLGARVTALLGKQAERKAD
jgi:signal transduction histidine kinase/CheY-like chemotaxis protein